MSNLAVQNFRHFKPAGPVSSAFIADNASKVRALLGPVGGGKTVSCVFDSIKRASVMPPCNDGIIRYRRAIIGSTYGQIERNLYPTWNRYLPRDGGSWTEGEWSGGGGRFAIHKLTWDVIHKGERCQVLAEYIFAAIGDSVVEEFMRGFEPTDLWGYELDQLPEAFITVGSTRVGRYPPTGDAPDAVSKKVGFHRCIIGDLNAPDVDTWFYRLFEEDVPRGFKLYKQPSGLSPRAENIDNLVEGYYENQVAVLEKQKNGKNMIKRMVHAKYAPSMTGKPVYDEYSDDIHLSPVPLKPIKGRPLLLGFDQGLTRPAGIIAQRAPSGQLRVLGEVVPGRMNARRFAHKFAAALLEIAPGFEIAGAWADPAGFDGADKEAGDFAWAETVSAELGIVIQPAPSNEIDLRLTSVSDELTFMIDGNTPGLLLSPTCKLLRRGFVSDYQYVRQRIGNTDRFADKPDKKNITADPHDGLQYLTLGEKGRHGVIQGKKTTRSGGWPADGSGGSTTVKSDFMSGW